MKWTRPSFEVHRLHVCCLIYPDWDGNNHPCRSLLFRVKIYRVSRKVITITCNPGSSASGWGWCVNLDTDHLGRLKHSITWFWSFSFRVDAWYTDSTSNILQALAQILRWVRVIAANGVRQPELRFTERADRIPAFQENFWIYPWLYYWVCFCHEALKTAIRVITIFV